MNSVDKVFNRYPNVQTKSNEPNNPQIILTNQEAVFYQLVQFFNQPETFQFSLNMIHDHLRDEDLLFAIEVIIEFFQKDTKHVKRVSQTFYDQHLLREQILGQKGFSERVEEKIEGIKFKPSMVNIYWNRPNSGRIPNADLIIDGTPYWKEETVDSFIEKERNYREEKKRRRMEKER